MGTFGRVGSQIQPVVCLPLLRCLGNALAQDCHADCHVHGTWALLLRPPRSDEGRASTIHKGIWACVRQ